MNTDDGGSAFPTFHNEGSRDAPRLFCSGGMTLRDYFAAALAPALLQIAAKEGVAWAKLDADEVVRRNAIGAYRMADAMLEERAK